MNNRSNPRPTIARIWRGRTRAAEFLIELPVGVQVLEIVAASGRTGGEA